MLWERLRHASTAHTLQQKNLRRFRRLPAAAWERTSRISSARIYSSFPKRATGCGGFRATQTAVPQRQHQGNTPRALPCPSTPLPVQPGRRQDGHHGVIEQRPEPERPAAGSGGTDRPWSAGPVRTRWEDTACRTTAIPAPRPTMAVRYSATPTNARRPRRRLTFQPTGTPPRTMVVSGLPKWRDKAAMCPDRCK